MTLLIVFWSDHLAISLNFTNSYKRKKEKESRNSVHVQSTLVCFSKKANKIHSGRGKKPQKRSQQAGLHKCTQLGDQGKGKGRKFPGGNFTTPSSVLNAVKKIPLSLRNPRSLEQQSRVHLLVPTKRRPEVCEKAVCASGLNTQS